MVPRTSEPRLKTAIAVLIWIEALAFGFAAVLHTGVRLPLVPDFFHDPRIVGATRCRSTLRSGLGWRGDHGRCFGAKGLGSRSFSPDLLDRRRPLRNARNRVGLRTRQSVQLPLPQSRHRGFGPVAGRPADSPCPPRIWLKAGHRVRIDASSRTGPRMPRDVAVITIGLLVAPAMGPFAGDRPSRIGRFDGID